MLFSRDDVARVLNNNFEPVWQSVRPVPIVRIDFGNGTVLTRTLNGNIATYLCSADGQVLDLVAGIYTPGAYLQRLAEGRMLAGYVDQEGPAKRAERLRGYHKTQLEALAKDGAPAVLVNAGDFAKRRVEGPVKAMLLRGAGAASYRARAAERAKEGADVKLESADDLASWKALREDTDANEAVRRRQVHELLAATGPAAPEALTKRVYKDVLHADLDDPYLGLGKTRFAGYPF